MTVDRATAPSPEALARSVLFADTPRAVLIAAADRCQPVRVRRGAVMCREGKPGSDLFIVEEGKFVVESMLGERRVRFAELGPGALFGEMSLLTGEPRSATVSAATDGRVWALRRQDFQELVQIYPQLGIATGRIVSLRLSDANRWRLANEKLTLLPFTQEKHVVTIGRMESNDVVLPDPTVSRVHALIRRVGDEYELVDLNSTSGTFLNGQRVHSQKLQDGDEIWIGSNPIYFDKSALTRYSRGAGVEVAARGLTTVVGGDKTILHNVSLAIYPGEFTCIVGGSGTGKTTLLHALNGFRPATEGQVLYNDVDYYSHFDYFRHALGYVPQEDIVHPELTVYQTLYYSARLRLPRDTDRPEIERGISEVLSNLELAEHRDQEVRSLSGGQRKRVSIGVELLTKPGVFYLDEPTSGLDPGLDTRMMELFRKLADQGRTIILTTHATKNIMMCDRVVFMARGGRLAFTGAPAEALEYFGVDDFIDIYNALERQGTPEEWEERFRQSDNHRRNVKQRLESQLPVAVRSAEAAKPADGHKLAGVVQSIWQFVWLSARYLTSLRRDRISVGVLLIQAPIIAAVLSSTFPHNVFSLTAQGGGDARQGVFLLFILAVASIWLGANTASRAITEESRVYFRERLVNLKIVPYIFSKVWILGLFSFIQSALLVGIISARVEIPGGTKTELALYGALALTNLAGMGMGLLVSSLARNGLQATAIVLVLLIPQLILAGASVPLSEVTVIGRFLSNFMISRWALSLLGHYVDINARLNAQLAPGAHNRYADQFAINPYLYTGVLVGLFAVFLVGTIVNQKRKDVR